MPETTSLTVPGQTLLRLATAGSVIDWCELLPMVTRRGGEALVLALEEGHVTPHATQGWRDLEG